MRFEIKRHEAARDVGEDAVYGVYVLRSNRDPTLMRIGGAGVRDRGTFRGRLATHNDAPTAVNWTTRNRTWRALWTATLLGGGSSKVIWAAEHILFARFSQDYPLVDQSGFSVAPLMRQASCGSLTRRSRRYSESAACRVPTLPIQELTSHEADARHDAGVVQICTRLRSPWTRTAVAETCRTDRERGKSSRTLR